MEQIPLAIGPLPEPRFDNFLPGVNAAALAHLQSLSQALPAAPVYLWGAGGSGKSHLLAALAATCHERGELIGWFDASTPLPWTLQPGWPLVVFDRCDAFDADAQHAAFALFEDATGAKVQIAAAGRLPPVDLPLRDDLRTRLAWGHVFALEPLPDADTRAALRREADRRGVLLSDEVVQYLLLHCPRDMGYLMQLLARIDSFGLSRARRMTVPLLKELLQRPEAQAA